MCVCVCVCMCLPTIWTKRESRNIGVDRAADHRAADGALLEAVVAALTDGEVAARDEHHRSLRGHAHDAVLWRGRYESSSDVVCNG